MCKITAAAFTFIQEFGKLLKTLLLVMLDLQTFNDSKSATEIVKKGVKCIQSLKKKTPERRRFVALFVNLKYILHLL